MYAKDTVVPVERTRAEIERLLLASKCTQFTVGHDSEIRRAMVQFKLANKIVRFVVAMPDPTAQEFTHVDRWRRRAAGQVLKMVAQAERQRWRALLLVIKAKLEAVESGITTFEQEFLAHIVMANDMTIGEVVIPKLQGDGPLMLEAHR